MSLFILLWKCLKLKWTKKITLFCELFLPLYIIGILIILRIYIPQIQLDNSFSKPMPMPSNGMMMSMFGMLCNENTPQTSMSNLNEYQFVDSRFYDYLKIYEALIKSVNLKQRIANIFSNAKTIFDIIEEIPFDNYGIIIRNAISVDDSIRDELIQIIQISAEEFEHFFSEFIDIRAVVLQIIKHHNSWKGDILALFTTPKISEKDFIYLFPNSDATFIKEIFKKLQSAQMENLNQYIYSKMSLENINVDEALLKLIKNIKIFFDGIASLNEDHEFSDISSSFWDTHPELMDIQYLNYFLCSNRNKMGVNVPKEKNNFPAMIYRNKDSNPIETCKKRKLGNTFEAISENKYPLYSKDPEMARTVLHHLNEFFKPFASLITMSLQYSKTISDIYCFLEVASKLTDSSISESTQTIVKYIMDISYLLENYPLHWLPSGFSSVDTEENLMKYFDPIVDLKDISNSFDSKISPYAIGISINGTKDDPSYKLIYMPYLTPRTYEMYPNAREYLPKTQFSYYYFKNLVIYYQDMVEYSIMKCYISDKLLFINKYISSMPRFGTLYDRVKQTFFGLLPIFLFFGYSQSISSIVSNLILEREQKKLDMIQIMGANQAKYLFTWFIIYSIISLVTIIPVTAYLTFKGFIVFSTPYIFFAVIFTFTVASFAFCILMYSIFDSAIVGANAGYLIFFILFIPFPILAYYKHVIPLYLNIISGLSLPIAFTKICTEITVFEELKIKLTLNNIFLSTHSTNDYGFAFYWLLMVADGIIYIFIAMCVIYGKKYGIFTGLKRKLKCIGSKKKTEATQSFYELNLATKHPQSNRFEHNSFNTQTTETNLNDNFVNIVHIYKKFPHEKNFALKDVSLALRKNEVTCLLGPNGAGKSTLLSVILGRIGATCGEIFIDGIEVTKNNCFNNVGFCPQFNILYEEFTVGEHLYFYSHLKSNQSNSNFNMEIDLYLEKMGMLGKKNVKVSSLSGGMRKKLSVGIAFIGNPQFVILDEPTAGIDSYSRRVVWDLISKFKKDSAILLTTHLMDEADILGDNVVFISEGRIIAQGCPFDLKINYGGGLKITFTKDTKWRECQVIEIWNVLENFIQNSKVVKCNKNDAVFELPKDSEKSRNFIQLLNHIEFNMEHLQIKEYGLDPPSLEDVFINLRIMQENINIEESTFHQCRLKGSNDAVKFIDDDEKTNKDSPNLSANINPKQPNNLDGKSCCDWKRLCHICTLFMVVLRIRMLRLIRDYRMIVCSLIIPSIFIILSCLIVFADSKIEREPTLSIDIKMNLKSPQYLVIGQQNSDFEDKDSLLMTLKKYYVMRDNALFRRVPSCLATDVYGFSESDNTNIGDQLNDSFYKYSWMSKPYDNCRVIWTDTCPLDSYLMASQSLYERKRPFAISFHNKFNVDYGDLEFSTYLQYDHYTLHSSTMGLNFVNNLIFRHNCIQTGAHCEHYSIKGYVQKLFYEPHDSHNFLNARFRNFIYAGMLLGVSISFIISSFCLFMVEARVSNQSHLFNMYGLNIWIYVIGNALFDMSIFLICALISLLVFKFTSIEPLIGKNSIHTLIYFMSFAYSTIPQTYAFSILSNSAVSTYVNLCALNVVLGSMGNLVLGLLETSNKVSMETISSINNYLLLIPQHSFVNSLLKIFKNHFYRILRELYPNSNFTTYHNYELKFTGKALISFVVFGTIGIIVQILVENFSNSRKRSIIKNKKKPNEFSHLLSNEHLDDDVLDETRKVIHNSFEHSSLNICMLKKKYSRLFQTKVFALKNVSFHLERGECFGLLGSNGAGKTTLFKILTNELAANSGRVSFGYHEDDNFNNSIFSYCPQFDALDMFLTPVDHIKLFSRLRGYSGYELDKITENLIKKYDLNDYSNKIVKNLSLGNRRKLMVSMCEIPNPAIILYDEPTAGMDPAAKRKILKTIQGLVKRGTSAILTSHNMGECQSLCDRLGIMIEGQFACIGTPQHLTKKFGSEYDIVVNVKIDEKDHVISLFSDLLPLAELKDSHMETLRFKLPGGEFTISSIFKRLTVIAQESNVKGFSVNQCKLEEVFIDLLKKSLEYNH